jgi:CRISPR/Cas system-associated exonuclease Cas4 (RecB family)
MFDERVLKHSPWSISKANLLDVCGMQYAFKYVEKKKESRKSAASRVGVVAHSLLEAELKSPGQDLKAILEEAATKEELSTEERREVLTRIPSVLDFATRIAKFKADNGVTDEFIEHQLAIKPDFSKTTFFDKAGLLRGVLDHGMITRDNVMIVLDHKSGKRKKIEEHSTQFYAYMLMVMANFPVYAVQCGINYIGSDKVDWFPRANGDSGAWTRDEVGKLRIWLEHYLNKSARKLTLIDDRAAQPETGWQCDYCGYVDACDVGAKEVEKRRSRRSGGAPNL